LIPCHQELSTLPAAHNSATLNNFPTYTFAKFLTNEKVLSTLKRFTKTDVDVLKSSWKRRGIVYKDYSEK
jgi:hypothetical protein